MNTAATPQMLIIGSLVAILLVALIARYFDQRGNNQGSHSRFGNDHSQAITEMGNRTRAEAQRNERDNMGGTSSSLSR